MNLAKEMMEILVAEMLVKNETVSFNQLNEYVGNHEGVVIESGFDPEIFETLDAENIQKSTANGETVYIRSEKFHSNPVTLLKELEEILG